MNRRLFFWLGCLISLGATCSLATEKTDQGKKPADKNLILPLLREEFPIVDRKAKLVRHPRDNRWFLAFEPFIVTKTNTYKKDTAVDGGASWASM